MSFIAPMLACPMPDEHPDYTAGTYVAEEKYDGHRLCVRISEAADDSLFDSGKRVQAWGRYGIARILPKHLVEQLQKFPVCYLDGELRVPGKRSYGVTELIHGDSLVYTVFDVLEVLGDSVMGEKWKHRRRLLDMMFEKLKPQLEDRVQLSPVHPVVSEDQLRSICDFIWGRDGEGVIVKNVEAPYLSDKRPKRTWHKMKQLRSSVLKVVGFEQGKQRKVRGVEIGHVARLALVDDEGNTTTVKTKNDDWLITFAGSDAANYIGKRLRIEYQERTPDGNYRHPRWDRWEE